MKRFVDTACEMQVWCAVASRRNLLVLQGRFCKVEVTRQRLHGRGCKVAHHASAACNPSRQKGRLDSPRQRAVQCRRGEACERGGLECVGGVDRVNGLADGLVLNQAPHQFDIPHFSRCHQLRNQL